MQSYITSTLKLGRKVSLVIWLIDQYSSLGCSEEVNVYLNGQPAVFQRKAGGYLVFTDLEADDYKILIDSPYYFPEEFTIKLSSLNTAEPLVYVPLKPAPSYRFNPGSTLLRASILSEDGSPVIAAIKAALTDDNCARAKLGRQGAKAGAKELGLIDLTGRMAPGDLLLIRPPEGVSGEICEISTMGTGDGTYALKQPLSADHNRGELLMPVFMSRSDSRGEAIIPIRQLRQKECQLQLAVSVGNTSQLVEVTLKIGETYHLGKITL